MDLVSQHPSLIRGTVADINPSHFGARHLRFAYNGNASGWRGIAGIQKDKMTQVGTAGLTLCADGIGVMCNAADTAFYTIASNVSDFTGDLTLMWRGVLLGDCGTSNNSVLIGVNYGNGTSQPYELFTLARTGTGGGAQTDLQCVSNNGTNYISNDNNFNLNTHYGKPITIVVSNPAGSNLLKWGLNFGREAFFYAGNHLNGTTANPRASTTNNRIIIGTNYGAGRYTNSVCTAAAIWSYAFNDTQLRQIAENHAAVFAPTYDLAFADAVASPPISAAFKAHYLRRLSVNDPAMAARPRLR